ncbi:transporter substrate-binding domain-containing protein [Cochlodiniinecator piscidefendens]|uniref:transporter substrate-binding domain-containing protein n=1 Tax=Cochlodiniinecator piscidefendens TaxID=2715756 RepID=UPI00140822D9|nr:transporter substrate-binding domain-containing protein [Cochlodiniinecator piscidefendens]
MTLTRRLFTTAAATALAVSATASLAGDAMDRITADGVLIIATSADWAPQSFLNDDNEMDGFDVDVAKEIANRLGVEAEFVTPAWEIITAGNWSGRWDVSVGSMTPTTARAEVLSFPAVYYYTPAVIAIHEDSSATSASDLNGMKFGVGSSSTYEAYAQHDLTIDAEGVPSFSYEVMPGEIRSYGGSSAVFDDLRLGDGVRLDATIDALPAILTAAENGYPFKILGDPVFFEPLAVAIDRGDAELAAAITAAVAAMREDGTLSALSVKWYGTDFTSTN